MFVAVVDRLGMGLLQHWAFIEGGKGKWNNRILLGPYVWVSLEWAFDLLLTELGHSYED